VSPHPAPQSGQATWARVDNKEHWSPVLASLATLTPPSLPVTAFNVAEVAPAPAPVPNVVEVADPIPIVIDDKDRRIAELERKVSLLTEAVVSLLAMKSEVEHSTLSRCEAAAAAADAHGTFSGKGGSLCRPAGASFSAGQWGMAGPKPIVLDGDAARAKADWTEALEELQATTVKTDSLIAALKE
jgi:hypothetical protein